MIVTGKVVRRDGKKATVFLDAGDNKLIECRLAHVDGRPLSDLLGDGKEARIFSSVTVPDSSEKNVIFVLDKCLLILGSK